MRLVCIFKIKTHDTTLSDCVYTVRNSDSDSIYRLYTMNLIYRILSTYYMCFLFFLIFIMEPVPNVLEHRGYSCVLLYHPPINFINQPEILFL